jgi:hypothetical protein
MRLARLTPQLSGKVRVPVEAEALHRALRDAETGKAQAEKGEPLDMLINSTHGSQTDLALAEGEVLKLPPTPDMTDGTEHESDPETERISHSTSSPSLSPSTAGRFGSTVPPPIPARGGAPLLPPRPPLGQQHSSQSFYSTEGDAELHETNEMPPAYQDGMSGSGSVPAAKDEKRSEVEVEREKQLERMTEAERAEWKQHWADEDQEALRGSMAATTLGEQPPSEHVEQPRPHV